MSADLMMLFSLLRTALCTPTERPAALPDEPELKRIAAVARAHGVDNLLADVAERFCPDLPTAQQLQIYRLQYAYQIEGMEHDLAEIRRVFNAAGIAFLPLKGSVLRELYPQNWMRTGCDIDVLVHETDAPRAAQVLGEMLGYTETERNFHNISLKTVSGGCVELHFDLIEEEELPRVAAILRHVWDVAVKEEECAYRLSDDMFLFYHVAHMAKHMARGGCGIRPFLDLYMLSATMDLDSRGLADLLQQAGLTAFFAACRDLAAVWMQGAAHTPLTEEMEAFIVHGGRYGAPDSALAARRARGESKLGHWLHIVFLPRRNLACLYPDLQKHPWLLPFYQVRRWFRVLDPGKRDKISRKLNVNRTLDEATVSKVGDLLHRLGIE